MTVDTPVEYALYALAVTRPDLFESAERFTGGMLATDQDALRRVKALVAAPACRCPVGFGQVVAEDCPRHNPRPRHTISGTNEP